MTTLVHPSFHQSVQPKPSGACDLGQKFFVCRFMMHHSLWTGSWDILGMKYDQLSHIRPLPQLICPSVCCIFDHHHPAGLCNPCLCFIPKVIGCNIGIYERTLCKAEEGEPPMDEQNRLREPAAPENLSSFRYWC